MPFNGYTGLPLKSFGSLCTLLDPTNVPLPLSPDCADVIFKPGLVATRPGLTSEFPINPNPTADYNYIKTYITQTIQNRMLALDSFAVLWKELPQGTLVNAATIEKPGAYGNSASLFGREYMAFSDGKFGTAIPRQYNDASFNRVSQVGPGAGPTIVDFLPSPATISNSASPATVSIATAVVSDPSSYTYTIPSYPPYVQGGTFNITVYSKALITTSSPHGLSVGSTVNISGVSSTFFNGTGYVVTDIISTTAFKYAIASYGVVAGTGGTLTIPAPSVIRTGNVVTVTTSAPHGFQSSETVIISGIANVTIGGTITAIARTTGEMMVSTSSANGLVPGSNVLISGVTGDLTLNGSFTVGSVQSATQFTIDNAGDNSVGTVSGSSLVQDVFNGIFTISSVPTASTFSYQDIGPNDQSSSAGVATVQGNVVAGTHQVAVSFVTESEYITPPSPPVTFIAAGGKLVALSNIPTGPSNVIQRILMFTPFLAPGTTLGSFYHRPETMIINDNVTTQFVTDFSDSYLLAGELEDGLFELIELGECASVTAYNERLFWTGERNKLQNFLNLTFDGGWGIPPPLTSGPLVAGNGVDGGGSNPWTTPNNITSSVSFATRAVSNPSGGPFTSNALNATQFGLSANSVEAIGGIQVSVNASAVIGSGVGISTTVRAQLFKGGIPIGVIRSATAGSTASTLVFGGPTDLWGTTGLIGSDVNAPTFGVQFSFFTNGPLGHAYTATLSLNNGQLESFQSADTFPLGWNLDLTNGFGADKESGLAIFGDAYKITGDGIEVIRGLITQGAYQDSFGAPLLISNIGYSVRIWVRRSAGLTAGNLNFDVFSPSGGMAGSLQITYSQATTSWQEFTGVLINTNQTVIPQDTLIRVYASGGPMNDGEYFLVDDIEIFPTLFPFLTSTVRASQAAAPENYDGVTGALGVAPENGQVCTSTFRIRDFLYLVKQRSLYVTADDGQNEPDLWSVNEVSPQVGSLSVRGVGLGDEWAIIASQNGCWYFDGSQFTDQDKLSKEIQPTWDSINWAYGHTIDVKVDTLQKRVYIAVPLGSATVPNKMLMLDYIEGFSDSMVQQPLGVGPGRKWTIWNIPCNSMNFVLRDDGTQPLFIGNNTGTGKIYGLNPNVASDDGAAIDSYWQSGYFQGDTRLLFGYLVANVVGSGMCLLTLRKGDQNWIKTIRGWTLNSNGFRNMERQIQMNADRMAIKFETNAVNHKFSLQGALVYVQEAPLAPVRGINS